MDGRGIGGEEAGLSSRFDAWVRLDPVLKIAPVVENSPHTDEARAGALGPHGREGADRQTQEGRRTCSVHAPIWK